MSDPITFKDVPPDDLLGAIVHVRPFYSVPVGRNSSRVSRSPWTFGGRVGRINGSMVIVSHFDGAPGMKDAAYSPDELHRGACRCPACDFGGAGLGTEVRNGA